MWWRLPQITPLGRLRLKDGKFEDSLGNTVRPCLKKEGRGRKEGGREASEWVTDSSVVKALSALARGPRV